MTPAMTKIERIPEHIMEQARALVAQTGNYPDSITAIAQALLAAEKRGKEEAAKIAEALGSTVSHGQPLTEFAQATRIATAIRSGS